jgi:putative nucleotidyltransferase with HDIG domain
MLITNESPREFASSDIRILTALSEIGGSAIHRTTLNEQTVNQLGRLAALRAIDVAITSSLDLKLTLNVVLDQVVKQLNADAADILLLKPDLQILEFASGKGFKTQSIEASSLRLGEGLPGRAALNREALFVGNLQTESAFKRRKLLEDEKFISYYAAPLIAKGKVKGVLEIFHRSALIHDPGLVQFLEALADQAAIAIDNSALFYDLQRSNIDLSLAYDATIEGWSRALDLRDKETEGHTQRVTEVALKLAHAMGVSDEQLVHIRRGALLHDIGKMGVPDGILLKPDKLTEEEWEVMRKHPVYAYEMLMPIAYLRAALDIPYCHHEKWDGTGYPRGLRGEQIPLSARIFAVVDVWDALRSNRPYRAGWENEMVLNYLREQSGKHFDPRVVEKFLGQVVSSE